jgi:predicted lipoprotein with Yx(FWY)xxD motif
MSHRIGYVALVAPLCVLTLGACGAARASTLPSSRPASLPARTSPGNTAAEAATVLTGTTSVGTVLTDSQGHTLYYLSAESTGQDDCTMQPGCSLMWPAVTPPATGSPVPGLGVNGVLGVITAADGSAEVTYNGWPLHTFSGEKAGEAMGVGNQSYGGTWSVATPDLAPPSNSSGSSDPGLTKPPALSTPPGALPTNPFAPTTPPGIPAEPPLPTIPSSLPTNPYS